MVRDTTPRVGDPANEILATSGLLMLLGAVVVAAVAVFSVGHGNMAAAGTLAVVAAAVFAGSLVCFAADSRRAEEAPLPFPSWLQTDAVATSELGAGQ